MNYQEAIDYIHHTPKFARELGNAMLEKLLLHLNNPQKNLRIVHIAGTNGKGSTAAMLSEILSDSGYRCGLYTSPYIERFNERIRIDGAEIPDDELARIITSIKETIEHYNVPVSEFALDTAVSFCWFSEQKCDFVVLETGLGGRLDATNVVQTPLATILTSIGMDHMQYLGNTIEKIAKEKCGIIKENCPVISYPMQEEKVSSVIIKTATEKNAPLFVADSPSFKEDRIEYKGKTYALGLQGEFQRYNAATVLETIHALRTRGISIPEPAVISGLQNAKNMARYERFGNRIILDGGHNVPAAEALISALRNEDRPIIFCVAMMEDKDCEGFLQKIASVTTGVVATEISMPRCADANKIATIFKKFGVGAIVEKNPESAIERAILLAGEDGIVCICGSLYLAGHVRPYLKKKNLQK